jgi:transglutaminase-like putative cysteine protease
MTSLITVRHRTEYRYDRPVILNTHRLMLRPRDGHDLWVEDARLTIDPPARLRWYFDTFGNSVAEATFSTPADHLLIESALQLRRYALERLVPETGPHVCPYPFVYTAEEMRDLGPFLGLQNAQDAAPIDRWLEAVLDGRPGSAVAVLLRLSDAVHRSLGYSRREEMGTQAAAETLRRGVGTCRDFAFLFMEAARRLGFAARFVTGYLNDASGGTGGGATHAWADVFVPGEGWIEFDPTNRITAGSALIRVATTRTPAQASPVSGSFLGQGATFLGLSVDVEVGAMEEA